MLDVALPRQTRPPAEEEACLDDHVLTSFGDLRRPARIRVREGIDEVLRKLRLDAVGNGVHEIKVQVGPTGLAGERDALGAVARASVAAVVHAHRVYAHFRELPHGLLHTLDSDLPHLLVRQTQVIAVLAVRWHALALAEREEVRIRLEVPVGRQDRVERVRPAEHGPARPHGAVVSRHELVSLWIPLRRFVVAPDPSGSAAAIETVAYDVPLPQLLLRERAHAAAVSVNIPVGKGWNGTPVCWRNSASRAARHVTGPGRVPADAQHVLQKSVHGVKRSPRPPARQDECARHTPQQGLFIAETGDIYPLCCRKCRLPDIDRWLARLGVLLVDDLERRSRNLL